jgi:acetylornithine deacetylase
VNAPQSPAELLAALVSIASPSGDEAAISDFVADVCAAWKIDCERLGSSLVIGVRFGAAARAGSGAAPRLLFNSHLDTVPIGGGWTKDPLSKTWDGDVLWGRGANDAKVSVAAMLWSLHALAESRTFSAGAHGTLQLALTECEETSNIGMLKVVEAYGLPDMAVTGEPTGLEVVRAQSGLAVLSATWHGKSCHAAHVARVDHVNALHVALREVVNTAPWLALPGEHPLLGQSTIATTMFHAGERHNVVPDVARARFDARLSPLHSSADVCALLQSRLPSASLSVDSDRLRPFETEAAHPIVRTAVAVLGRERAIGSATMSDMALLQGVPAIKCGPGQTARSHTPDEFVLRGELEAGVAFYTQLAPQVLKR